MKKGKNYILFFILIGLVTIYSGCLEDPPEAARCKLNVDKKRVIPGQSINFDLSSKPLIAGTSGKFYFNGLEITETPYNIGDVRLGKHRLLAEMMMGDSIICESYKTIEVYSDVVPTKLEFEVVREYPHNEEAYTQGLLWYEDELYEGTGQYGESILAKVDHRTGEYKTKIELGMDLFGEGVTILNDKIYQLTYISQKCLVYDVNTFEKIDEFEYSSKEGWGLTTDGEALIMSNGTNVLTFFDPGSFKALHTIEVYDQRKRLVNLNELEYVDGMIYSNIYQSEEIAVIEAKSGKVVSYIDCSGLLKNTTINKPIDVLNGIAYHPNSGNLFVTGKWWPKMFELKLN
ncbi:MAG: glutaminyl-peptide cyclotransferase [Flavobacteriales bacterium]|nr:glutaminyl-peptide cyclotransferase [Flavobacteriales bacterium]